MFKVTGRVHTIFFYSISSIDPYVLLCRKYGDTPKSTILAWIYRHLKIGEATNCTYHVYNIVKNETNPKTVVGRPGDFIKEISGASHLKEVRTNLFFLNKDPNQMLMF